MPARSGRTPFKAVERDRRYKAIIEAATAHAYETWHIIPVTYPDARTAKAHASKIYAEARFQGHGRQVHYVGEDGTVHESARDLPEGPYRLQFRLFDKNSARAYVAKGREGKGLAYNTRRARKEK